MSKEEYYFDYGLFYDKFHNTVVADYAQRMCEEFMVGSCGIWNVLKKDEITDEKDIIGHLRINQIYYLDGMPGIYDDAFLVELGFPAIWPNSGYLKEDIDNLTTIYLVFHLADNTPITEVIYDYRFLLDTLKEVKQYPIFFGDVIKRDNAFFTKFSHTHGHKHSIEWDRLYDMLKTQELIKLDAKISDNLSVISSLCPEKPKPFKDIIKEAMSFDAEEFEDDKLRTAITNQVKAVMSDINESREEQQFSDFDVALKTAPKISKDDISRKYTKMSEKDAKVIQDYISEKINSSDDNNNTDRGYIDTVRVSNDEEGFNLLGEHIETNFEALENINYVPIEFENTDKGFKCTTLLATLTGTLKSENERE